MFKYFLTLALGLGVGYWYGFSDAQVHTDNIAVRMVHQIGGQSRKNVHNDTDRQMDSLERR